jgi:hypothetical protein
MKRSQNLRRLAAIKATGEEDIQSSGDLAVLDGAGTFAHSADPRTGRSDQISQIAQTIEGKSP